MKENDNFSVSRNSEVSAFPRRMSCLSSFAFYMDVSVQFSRSVLSDSLRPHGLQHARPPCPSPTPGVYSNSCPLSWWCHPIILSSVVPFSSCLQSFPSSGSFPVSQFFTLGGQSIGVSASASVLPMNIQGYYLYVVWSGIARTESWIHLNIVLYNITLYRKILPVQFSHSVVSDPLWPHEQQQARPPCRSPAPGVHPNQCPSS